MERVMKRTAAISTLLAIVFFWIDQEGRGIVFSLAVTSGTVAYHFLMRLVVGMVLNGLLHNRVDDTRAWFRVSEKEMRLYRLLRVKKWKNRMPTYDPSAFDPTIHTWDEIAQAMCQSELVHECNALLSFLPLLLSLRIGGFWVFFITSVLSAGFDLLFVAMQRFNRPRIQRLRSRNRA